MKRIVLVVPVVLALASAARARAEPAAPADPAIEVNVLWPLIGISELKVVLPETASGQLVTGIYADYAQVIRPDAGKVALIAGMIGWRQFLVAGLHVELTAIAGVRHEKDHPGDGMTLNDGYVRAFPMVGYELAIAPRCYVNARAGAGLLVYRESHWSEEKKVAPAVDINLGVAF